MNFLTIQCFYLFIHNHTTHVYKLLHTCYFCSSGNINHHIAVYSVVQRSFTFCSFNMSNTCYIINNIIFTEVSILPVIIDCIYCIHLKFFWILL